MRGLLPVEYAFLRSQDVACGGGGNGGPRFTIDEEALAGRLVTRGLLRWETCDRCENVRHVAPTAEGRTAMLIHEQTIALYGAA